jgi:hypothetical protein
MTGSGKTGLGIALIEEAALDGIPVIVIDPKGDMGNLLLTFPQLHGTDFLPWVNHDDALRSGKSVEQFAADEAQRWSDGLAAWDQDGQRIERLQSAAEFALYTPGSSAGTPVSVLSSFAAPATDDPELRAEQAQTAVSGLLTLAGIDSDPLKSREHILLSLILISAWEAGESPDLATLIQRVQQPPLQRVGVMELDSFFPAKDRFGFAMALNSLIAAPGFAVWTQGSPLDIGSILRNPSGQPRVSVFTISHLDDRQRMFFVSLLLSAVVGWMRSQSGTSSLRALLYMDEIFGFFPPVANPPSKAPLLTLLKQARAHGLGVVLSTQNPVDLDYKGLGNIGTWWLGRLQTERDKARLLDGLESSGSSLDRAQVDKALSGLRKRCFLMRNVHDKDLCMFETRWVMSYLRGPLSREDIRRLSSSAVSGNPNPEDADVIPAGSSQKSQPRTEQSAVVNESLPPVLPPDIPQHFLQAAEGEIVRPYIYATVELRYSDSKLKVEHISNAQYLAPLLTGPVPLSWENAERSNIRLSALLDSAPSGVSFAALPGAAVRKTSYTSWASDLARWLRANEALELMHCPRTRQNSQPDESERDFRVRLQQALREQRDTALTALRSKYGTRQAALEERLRKAQQAVQREQEQARGQKLQTAISVGSTLVGALLGRKAISASTIGKATTAARGAGRAAKELGDVARAQETVAALQEQLIALDIELEQEAARLPDPQSALHEPLETIQLLPKRGDVKVALLTLLWLPD